MSELYRVIIVALLLIDVHRGILITSTTSIASSRSSSRGSGGGGGVSVVGRREGDDDERRPTTTARSVSPACRPPTSDTLWLRLRHRSSERYPPTMSSDDVESTRSVGRYRRAVERPHGRRRRHERGRRRRWRVKWSAAAANATYAALDTIRRRHGRGRRRGDAAAAAAAGAEASRGRRRAWQCGLEKFWRRTGRGVFPAYVHTGRCTTPTCMMGLYECRERRYSVGVLRRRRGRCVPLPLATNSTAAEELWTPAHVAVVVSCECSARRATGVFAHAAAAASSSPPPVTAPR